MREQKEQSISDEQLQKVSTLLQIQARDTSEVINKDNTID
jgi:hypothetical protein